MKGRRLLERENRISVPGVNPLARETLPPRRHPSICLNGAPVIPDAKLEIAVNPAGVDSAISVSRISIRFEATEREAALAGPGEALGRHRCRAIPGSKQTLRRPGSPQSQPIGGELERFGAGGGHLSDSAVACRCWVKALEGSEGLEGRGAGGVEALGGAGPRYFAAAHPLSAPPRPCASGQAQALLARSAIWSWRVSSCIRGSSQSWEPGWRTAWSKAMACRPLGRAARSGWWQPMRRRWGGGRPTCMGLKVAPGVALAESNCGGNGTLPALSEDHPTQLPARGPARRLR